MRQLLRGIKRFIRSDEGPTAVEYAVMIALLIAGALAAVQSHGSTTKQVFNKAANSLGS